MMKEKKLNLEPLIIRPSMDSHHQDLDHGHDDQPTRRGEEVEQQPRALQQPLTIFYNGQVSTCSVYEFQARAILMVARREMEEAKMVSCSLKQQAGASRAGAGAGAPQLGRSLSMKRSLQQFLHKRKIRTNTNTTTTSTHHH